MAPDNGLNTGCFWLDTNRHSHRILNKNAVKFDISTVNNKMDFMRSLNLFCIKNTKESYLKVDWEVSLPKNSVRLKKCSVVLSGMKCDICGQSLKNHADVNFHKSLHSQSTNEDCKNNENSLEQTQFLNNCEKQNMKENFIECNNNNIVKSENKIKSDVHKRRSKDAVTKVTLKIGGEVISKVYCKKKYLNKIRSKSEKATVKHHHDDCNNCNEIKDILHSTKMNTQSANILFPHQKQANIAQSDRNIARLRKMAAALVRHELQQQVLRSINRSNSLNDKRKTNNVRNDDAVVPVADNINLNSNSEDDEIQEVLRITRNLHSTEKIDTNHKSLRHVRKHKIKSIESCEIITIDDEICDDLEDDCIIIDERMAQQNFLRNEETSYVFHISDKGNSKINNSETGNLQNSAQKRKSCVSNSTEYDHTLKKQKTANALCPQFNHSINLDTCDTEKENKNCQGPIIKLSQLALPLRLMNF